jgi:hypothetical protein
MLRFFSVARTAGAPSIALALCGCAALGDIGGPSCGNGVVEANEDCDQRDATTSGNACGQPGTVGACRFICAPGGPACPTGFTCGIDEVCRKPVSPPAFTGVPRVIAQTAVNDLVPADVDGDGLTDLLAVSEGALDVHFFDPDRTSTADTNIVAAESRPTVGVLARSDPANPIAIVADVSGGVGVFTGSADRTVTAIPYVSVQAPGGHLYATPYVYHQQAGSPDGSAFYLYTDAAIVAFDPTKPTKGPLPFGHTRIALGPAAFFNQQIACQQVALPFDDGHVRVFSSCGGALGQKLEQMADVALPSGVLICGATVPCHALHVGDLNGDGKPDLLIVGSDKNVYVTYSDGMGGFIAQPTTMMGVNQATVTLPGLPAGLVWPPIAVVDLNGDCAPDFVDAENIWVSYGIPKGVACTDTPPTPLGYESVVTPADLHGWTEAFAADMNGDGRLDIVVSSSAYPGITIHRGTGEVLFNPVDIVTQGPTQSITHGDFDGDGVEDLAFAEVSQEGSPNQLFLSWGATSGPPSPAVPLGPVASVSQIVVSDAQQLSVTHIANPYVAAYDDVSMQTSVYLYAGSGSRQVYAPYYLLQAGVKNSLDVPRRSALGAFSTPTTDFAEIAVFARPKYRCALATCESRLWLLPTGKLAMIPPAMNLTEPPPGLPNVFVAAEDALIANTGPAASGQPDRVALAVPSASDPTTAALVVASADAATHTFSSFGAEKDVSGFALAGAAGLDGHLVAVDLDGTGQRHLVLAAPPSNDSTMNAPGGIAVMPFMGTGLGDPVILAYSAIAQACKGDPKGTPPALGVAPIPSDAAVARQVSLAPGTIVKQSLVAVTPAGAAYVELSGTSLVATCLGSMGSGGNAVATGDFDGDGIDDIAISSPGGISVFYGNAYCPGGKPPTSTGCSP